MTLVDLSWSYREKMNTTYLDLLLHVLRCCKSSQSLTEKEPSNLWWKKKKEPLGQRNIGDSLAKEKRGTFWSNENLLSWTFVRKLYFNTYLYLWKLEVTLFLRTPLQRLFIVILLMKPTYTFDESPQLELYTRELLQDLDSIIERVL